MKALLSLAWKSLCYRKVVTILSILSIGLSVSLLLSIERIRMSARESFSSTISQTSLIVGARGGSLQLLLYSVFHRGTALANVKYSTFEKYQKHPAVEWAIPISLGDSHQGYRVVATSEAFFKHYRYRRDHSLIFKKGEIGAKAESSVVLGSEVAESLRYSLGSKIVLSHGDDEENALHDHADRPFQVTGILAPTNTPLDRALFISLGAMEMIHEGWENGVPPESKEHAHDHDHEPEQHEHSAHEPEQLTSFFIKTKAPQDILRLQQDILGDRTEPLMAIIPGVALAELWDVIAPVEKAIKAIGLLVFLVGLFAMLLALYTTLHERRREMAILRALGLQVRDVFSLLIAEALLLSMLGIIVGLFLVTTAGLFLSPILENQIGVSVALSLPTPTEWKYLAIIFFTGGLVGIVPAWKAYRNSLADGLSAQI